mgnify:CR=1 FL=1
MPRLLALALYSVTTAASAQTPVATDVPKADLDATLARAPAAGVMDQQIRVVDIGKYNVAVGVLHRAAKAKHTAIAHAQVTEVYHILQGTGRARHRRRDCRRAPVAADSEIGEGARRSEHDRRVRFATARARKRRSRRSSIVTAGRRALVQRGRRRHELPRGSRRREPRAADRLRERRAEKIIDRPVSRSRATVFEAAGVLAAFSALAILATHPLVARGVAANVPADDRDPLLMAWTLAVGRVADPAPASPASGTRRTSFPITTRSPIRITCSASRS